MRFLKQGLFVSLMLIIMNPITSNTMHIMEAFFTYAMLYSMEYKYLYHFY